VNGENGGPGAVFHSLRSITNTLSICADIERYCPDAFLINLSNPMSRVTLAINEATNLRNVGMCHEMPIGVTRLGRMLRIRPEDIDAKASGINHFTFFTELRHRGTGEDLLPRVKALFARRRSTSGPPPPGSP
jgi:alpha-galactosidase